MSNAVYLLLADQGPLHFDVVLSESVEYVSEVTESPVEKGANVTDHVRTSPVRITIDAFYSSHPIYPEDVQGGGSRGGSVNGVSLAVPSMPPRINSLSSALSAAASEVTSLLGGGSKDPNVASVLTFSKPVDGPREALAILENARRNAELVTVISGTNGFFENCIVERVATRKDSESGCGADITVTLRELFFVAAQEIVEPDPEFTRAKKKIDRGKQDTKPVETKKTSLLKAIANAVGR